MPFDPLRMTMAASGGCSVTVAASMYTMVGTVSGGGPPWKPHVAAPPPPPEMVSGPPPVYDEVIGEPTCSCDIAAVSWGRHDPGCAWKAWRDGRRG